jgi:hypothetical protein
MRAFVRMNLKKALDLIFYGASAMAILSLPFLLVNWLQYMRARARAAFPSSRAAVSFPAKSIGLFVTSILIAVAVASVATTSARQEAQRFLRELPSDATVYVNGQPISDQEEVLSTLKGVASYWAHHSHPTTLIRLDVTSSKGNLALELGRDSGNPREYWVFSPEQGITSKNEIGRITTSAFDKY